MGGEGIIPWPRKNLTPPAPFPRKEGGVGPEEEPGASMDTVPIAEAEALEPTPPLEDIKTEHGLRRLHYIDGVRAFAALWVILFHGWQAGNPLAQVPVLGYFFRFITQGQLPVLIFLVLSGFCLYYPLVLKDPLRPVLKTGYGAFCVTPRPAHPAAVLRGDGAVPAGYFRLAPDAPGRP